MAERMKNFMLEEWLHNKVYPCLVGVSFLASTYFTCWLGVEHIKSHHGLPPGKVIIQELNYDYGTIVFDCSEHGHITLEEVKHCLIKQIEEIK